MGREVFIGKKRTNKLNTGGATVGTTVSTPFDNSRNLQGGVQVIADSTNTGVVYLGVRDNLTAGTNADTDGFPIGSGESIFMPVDREDEIRARSDAAAQGIHIMSF